MNAAPDKALRRTLRDEGYLVQPIKARAPYLRGYQFSPDIIFDIGVGDGSPWLYRSFPKSRFVLIDPLEHCAEVVRAKGHLDAFHFHAVALGNKEQKAELNVPFTDKGERANLASLHTRVDHLADAFVRTEAVEVAVKTLDKIAVAYPGSVGLKVDVSGAEQDILKGAAETLKRSDFVILVLSVTKRFDNPTLPSQAISMLAKAGLELRDIISVGAGSGKKARPRFLEVLFARWATS